MPPTVFNCGGIFYCGKPLISAMYSRAFTTKGVKSGSRLIVAAHCHPHVHSVREGDEHCPTSKYECAVAERGITPSIQCGIHLLYLHAYKYAHQNSRAAPESGWQAILLSGSYRSS